jgi:hypothetical protein
VDAGASEPSMYLFTSVPDMRAANIAFAVAVFSSIVRARSAFYGLYTHNPSTLISTHTAAKNRHIADRGAHVLKCSVGQVRICNVLYVLDRVNRYDRFSMKKPLRSSARGVVRVMLLDSNSCLALCSRTY